MEEKKKNSFSSSEDKEGGPVKEHKDHTDPSKKDQSLHKPDHPKHDAAALKNDVGHAKPEHAKHEPAPHKGNDGGYSKHDGYSKYDGPHKHDGGQKYDSHAKHDKYRMNKAPNAGGPKEGRGRGLGPRRVERTDSAAKSPQGNK